jgi:hypothetical protein
MLACAVFGKPAACHRARIKFVLRISSHMGSGGGGMGVVCIQSRFRRCCVRTGTKSCFGVMFRGEACRLVRMSDPLSAHCKAQTMKLLQGNKLAAGFETWLVGAVDQLRRGGLLLRTEQRMHGRTLLASFGAWAEYAADAAADRAMVRPLLERLIRRRAAVIYKAWTGAADDLQRRRRIEHQFSAQMRSRKLSAACNGWADETEASAAKYMESLSQPTKVRSLPQCLMCSSVPALAR